MPFSLTESLALSTVKQRLIVAGAVGLAAAAAGAVWWYRRPPKPVFKPVGKLSEIWIHPIKSCRGYRVASAECAANGLYSNGLFDRFFVILGETDLIVTLRTEPSLALLMPGISQDGQSLVLNAPGMDPLNIRLADMTGLQKQAKEFRVWGLDAEGLDCGKEAGAWIGTYLKKPNQTFKLVHFKEGQTKPRTPVKDKSWGTRFTAKDQVMGYSDFAPIMLLSEASLDDLNSHLEKPVTVRNARPNFLVSGSTPFAEDNWKHVRIGDSVTIRRTHGCGRCKLTTVDPETGVIRSDGEPLATLKQYRTVAKSDPDSKPLMGAPVFGANFFVDVFGTVAVGDTVYAAL